MKIQDGTIITIDAIRWNDGWDFDCPGLILRPVLRYYDNGSRLDDMIEDLCIDACVDKKIESEDIAHEFEWRGWNLKYLKNVFNQALKGKRFPNRQYEVKREEVKFYINKDGSLEFSYASDLDVSQS